MVTTGYNLASIFLMMLKISHVELKCNPIDPAASTEFSMNLVEHLRLCLRAAAHVPTEKYTCQSDAGRSHFNA